MKRDSSGSMARDIMLDFAAATGLQPPLPSPRRYLWTDAFAVCNYLGLYRRTGDAEYRDLALRLIGQVHTVLGRHRANDQRAGWISGLGEEEGRNHPTKGGLRIGKELNERSPGEAYDESLEWDRDGQYYHYLTKWMHALNRATGVTGDPVFNRWAIELVKAAHKGFTYHRSPESPRLMYWKASIDLSYPVVTSMGHHDPLDGFITCLQLQAAAAKDATISRDLNLGEEIDDMADMCVGKNWATDDPLGLGELMSSAFRLAQLIAYEDVEETGLLADLLKSSLTGVTAFAKSNPLLRPAEYRLAFRELGLSIGLQAAGRLQGLAEQTPALHAVLERAGSLKRYKPLSDTIVAFWLEPANRRAGSWTEHQDINTVMLATSLAPDGYLSLF